jgi:hypothetical protein
VRISWQNASAVPPQLSIALCSITPTQRRRFFWAAWWTSEPGQSPFRRPDASNGGARTFEDALVEAQCIAGRTLTIIDPYWARAWKSVLRGTVPMPPSAYPKELGPGSASAPPQPQPAGAVSAWSVLGLAPGASLVEVKRAFQRRALETHPDQGGQAEQFRQVQRAYEKLLERLERATARPQRRR